MGVKNVLFIEVNFVVYEWLKIKVVFYLNVKIVNCVISNENFMVEFYVIFNE